MEKEEQERLEQERREKEEQRRIERKEQERLEEESKKNEIEDEIGQIMTRKEAKLQKETEELDMQRVAKVLQQTAW